MPDRSAAAPRDPDDLITRLVDHVFALSGRFASVGDRIAAPEGLSAARWLVLGAIRSGPLTPAAIARKRGLSRQSIRESVERLERSGHIVRLRGRDQRTFLVELTDRGREALDRIEPRRQAWAVSTAAQIETDQLDRAVAALAQIRGATSHEDGDGEQ